MNAMSMNEYECNVYFVLKSSTNGVAQSGRKFFRHEKFFRKSCTSISIDGDCSSSIQTNHNDSRDILQIYDANT